jgi:large subunit ribosomal protein L25
MATYVDLKAEKREPGRKGPSRRLRASGKIPAVIYGHGDSAAISFELREFERALIASPDGPRSLLRLSGHSGQTETAIIQNLTRDPVSERIVHIDFYRIRQDKPIEMLLPLRLKGQAKGAKIGGIQAQMMREIRVRCLPDALPHDVQVDVSDMGIGAIMRVKDLPAQEGIEFLSDPQTILASVQAPKRGGKGVAGGVDETPAGDQPAEPELVGRRVAEEKEEGEK